MSTDDRLTQDLILLSSPFPRFARDLCMTLLAIMVLIATAAAQRGGGVTGANRPSQPPRTPTSDVSNTPAFVSGKVMLEGGGTLAEPVAIERMCNGTIRREGYTDFKGHFQIQLGQTFGFQDASENDPRATPGQSQRPAGQSNSRSTPSNLTGCEFRAVLAGFQSTTVMLRPSTGDSFQTELGTIILKRIGDSAGSTVSLTSLSAPKSARQAYEKGNKAFSEDNFDEAVKELNKATQKYPQFAAAWSLLGDVYQQRNQLDLASEQYKKALEADPQFVNPLYGLALVAAQQRKWQDVVDYTAQVINLNAYAFPSVYFFNAAANYNVGRFDVAEENGRKYKAGGDRRHPEVSLLLGSLLARREDYAGAAQQLKDYLAAYPTAPNAPQLQAQVKQYEQLGMAKR